MIASGPILHIFEIHVHNIDFSAGGFLIFLFAFVSLSLLTWLIIFKLDDIHNELKSIKKNDTTTS